jgi:N-acetylmuramic acid 6-phosphate etherase
MIENESSFYQHHEGAYYLASANAGLTVLTDTTERSPTFSLPYFENDNDPIEEKRNNPSLCRVMIKNSANPAEAWKAILGREPKALNWDEKTSMGRLLGNNISAQIPEIRRTYIDARHHSLEVELNEHVISLKLDNELLAHFELSELASLPPTARDLAEQIFLKILLNDASTLIAGRLDLYESNLMTNVRPSNNKLVERGKRLTYALIEQAGQQADASAALKAYIADPDRLKSLISEIFDQQKLIEDPNKAVVVRTKAAVLAAIARGSDANLTARGGFAEASSGAAGHCHPGP